MNIALFRVMKSFTTGRQKMAMGGGEEFSNLSRELARRGHRVSVYCETGRKTAEEILSWGLLLKDNHEGLDDDEDVLLIDNGAGMNLLWSPTQLTLPRRMARMYQLIASAKCPIVYSQSDPAPGMRMLTEIDLWMSLPSKVGVRQFVNVPAEPLKGKKLMVFMAQQNPAAYGASMKTKYNRYDLYNPVFEHLDLAPLSLVGREYPEINDTVSPNLVYVGHARYRRRLALYYNRPDAHVYGRWPEATFKGLLPEANWHEPINAVTTLEVYNHGALHVVVKDDSELGYGARPTRLFEAVQGGCPVYVDYATFDYKGVKSEPYWKWIIKPEQMDNAMKMFSLDDDKRKDLAIRQRAEVQAIDPYKAVDDLLALLEKHL